METIPSLMFTRLHRERAEQRRREQQESQAPRPSPAPEWRAPERVPWGRQGVVHPGFC